MNVDALKDLKSQTKDLYEKFGLLISKISQKELMIEELKRKNLELENKLKQTSSNSLKQNNVFYKTDFEKKTFQNKIQKYITSIDKCVKYMENL
ncbi:MAG: hypothetical protein GY830_00570 [Bacteroidetes bacterium]|nr:hypothetical protein [Bacteroidota bacterium]